MLWLLNRQLTDFIKSLQFLTFTIKVEKNLHLTQDNDNNDIRVGEKGFYHGPNVSRAMVMVMSRKDI